MRFHPALCTESQCLADMVQVGSQYGFENDFIVTKEAAHLDVAHVELWCRWSCPLGKAC